ncbi:MAG: Wadjet anti-phage system protein JetD domain-containing protein [Pseudomonadota bacterium]
MWTGVAELRAQVQRVWDDGRLLAARVAGESMFPLVLRLRQPSVAEMGAQFDMVRRWIRELEEGSRAATGHGYDIVWREVNHRQLGRNMVPDKIVIAEEGDALRWIGRQSDARRFDQLAQATLTAWPQLQPWLARRALAVLGQAEAWTRILAIVHWFIAHPRPGLYLRQLDIEGVDSKFIETRKGMLSEMLDQILPPESIESAATGARQFEQRYGLLNKPALVRFRILDPKLYIAGMSDISIPVAEFVALRIGVRRVFITENEVNGLAFPDCEASMVVFGGGYGVDRLAAVAWLRDKDVMYWGDIDTHGFAILDRLRASLPQARSMLMDEATLRAHRVLWGAEEADKRFAGQLTRLDDAERCLFEALRDNVHGERIRLEQERLGFGWVAEAIRQLTLAGHDSVCYSSPPR